MATAKLVYNVSSVVLTLSQEEAAALYSVLCRVGGSPTASRRGLIDNIYDALIEVKVDRGERDLAGSVTFLEEEISA